MAKLNLLCDECRSQMWGLQASAKDCPNGCGLRSYASLHQCDVCSILTDTCESCGKPLGKKVPKAHKRRVQKALDTCNRRKQAAQDKYEAAIAPFKEKVETFERESRRSAEIYDKSFHGLRGQFGLCEHQNHPENPDLKIGGATYQEHLTILQDAFREHNTRIQEAFSGPDREAYTQAVQVRTNEIRTAENYLAAVADFVIGIYNCHMQYKSELANIRENARR